MAAVSHTKGAAFRAFVEWVHAELGGQKALEVHGQLPADLAKLVDPNERGWGIAISTWYPDALLNRLLEIYLDPLDRAVRLDMLARGTQHAVNRTYRGVYRHVIGLLVSPQRCARHVNRLWRLHYDTGTVTWRYTAPARIDSELVGWKGHHPYRCEINRLSERLTLEMLGCKHVQSRLVKCVDRGDRACGCISEWAAR